MKIAVISLVSALLLGSAAVSTAAPAGPDDDELFSADPSFDPQVDPTELESRPRGIFIPVDPGTVDLRPPGAASIVIFMNRYGGTYTFGNNDSRTNHSSIINGSVTIPPYSYGDASWQQMMSCFREIYAPFNIEVTDVDPGTAPHIESVIGGAPGDAGFQANVGGVAPFSCGVISNAVVYTFSGIYGNRPREICETAAQETAHAFGLDHEYYCPNPMTYLVGCGNKAFRDYDSRCGEYSARNCMCGGSTQNSYRRILALFGSRTATPPTVSITSPNDGSVVQPGFAISVQANDSLGVRDVELFIDNVSAGLDTTLPYTFATDNSVRPGAHTLRVRATNFANLTAEDSISVSMGDPCTGNSQCDDGYVCYQGACIPGPDIPGGLGQPCTVDQDCMSGICGAKGGDRLCVDFCALDDPASCPAGFDCTSTNNGNVGVCWGGSTGCCAIVGAGALADRHVPWLMLALALGVFAGLRRHRRRRQRQRRHA